jgi:hypothetical protein
MFDLKKWTEDRIETENEIRALKERQRESNQPRWRGYLDGPALLKAKRRAHALYTYRAHRRGRIHAIAADPEATKKLIEEMRVTYETQTLTPQAAAQ